MGFGDVYKRQAQAEAIRRLKEKEEEREKEEAKVEKKCECPSVQSGPQQVNVSFDQRIVLLCNLKCLPFRRQIRGNKT